MVRLARFPRRPPDELIRAGLAAGSTIEVKIVLRPGDGRRSSGARPSLAETCSYGSRPNRATTAAGQGGTINGLAAMKISDGFFP